MLNAAKLRAKMVESGISQKKLAEKIGLSESTLSSRMTGATQFNADEIIQICEYVGIKACEDKCAIFLA